MKGTLKLTVFETEFTGYNVIGILRNEYITTPVQDITNDYRKEINNMTKPTKSQIKKERSKKKKEKVLKQKGYSDGKLPKNKELHHIEPVSEGGKTTNKNTRVVSKQKHKQIHKNRRKRGKT